MNPSLAHYQLLRRLRQHLRHHNGMGVVYLFSDHALANQWLLAELDAHLRARSMRLRLLQPAAAAESPAVVLEPLLAPGPGLAGMPCCLAMSEPQAEWDAYRDKVLARLNENRAVLSRNKAFVFLLLPGHFENRAVEVAPDLWSVRSAAYRVAPWLASEEGAGLSAEPRAPASMPAASLWGQSALAPVMQRWQTQWEAWCLDRSHPLSPTLAWQLVEQLMERQRPDLAKVFARQALEASRQLKTLSADEPQSLRDLSLSLNNVGDVARDLGQLEEARDAYRESLEISRRLKALTGESPQSLRDLSVSLNNVGNVARDLGQLEEARDAYRESLEIRRRLKALTGESPQSLRDLSVSLDNVGNVARDLGQLEEACDAYREALELVRPLSEVLSGDRELAPFEASLASRLEQLDKAVRD